MAERPTATRDAVEAAIREIRAYHKRGLASLREHPARGGRVGKSVDEQAAELGWNPTRLRKARQFAGEGEGYSPARLEKLFGQLRERRPVFGVSHVGVLVTISWADGRAAVQRRCIKNNWSKAELLLEVRLLRPPLRQGGRRRRVGADPARALVQLGRMADTWLRWCKAAAGDEGDAAGVLGALPKAVRDRVQEVSAAMRGLQQAIAGKPAAARVGS